MWKAPGTYFAHQNSYVYVKEFVSDL